MCVCIYTCVCLLLFVVICMCGCERERDSVCVCNCVCVCVEGMVEQGEGEEMMGVCVGGWGVHVRASMFCIIPVKLLMN